MHSSAALSLLVFLLLWQSQLEFVRVRREASRHRHRRHPSRRGLALRLNACLAFLDNHEQKASASRSRTSLLNTVTMLRRRVVSQYRSTIARRELDAPPRNSHQSVGVGLVHTAEMYTGKFNHVFCRYLNIAECLPSPLRKAHGLYRYVCSVSNRLPITLLPSCISSPRLQKTNVCSLFISCKLYLLIHHRLDST